LYTDDTQMTLAVAEGLLDAGLDTDLDTRMNAVGLRLVRWLYSRENNRAAGITSTSGVERFKNGLSWRESGLPESKGCGAAIRVASTGYFYQHDDARLKETAQASSLITHRHPTAVAAAIGAAYLVKLALDGVPVSEYTRRVMEFVDGLSEEFDAAIYRVGHAAAWTDEEAALEHIGLGWRGDEAVALALYCVLRYPDDYAACVRRAANTNGDSDSIACIVGGIMGARLGLDAIPADWQMRCENITVLQLLAGQMASKRDAFMASAKK
jgi:ADP-ribosylglycohydrolase